jgi:hypothetical protein
MDSKLLSPEDRHDIERSFDAIDDEKIGKIDVDRLYVLFLGLGYSTNHPHVSKVDLAAYVPQFRHDAVDLDDVLRIFSCVSFYSHSLWRNCSFRLNVFLFVCFVAHLFVSVSFLEAMSLSCQVYMT